MAAPKGNKFWEARSRHGTNPRFSGPEPLWDAALEYFTWVEDNPLLEAKAFNRPEGVVIEHVPKMRAMTLSGFQLFLGISAQTWSEWRTRKDLAEVVAKIERAIREQKFVGAAADLLNSNIIARDLGLRDGVEHTGPDGGPIQTQALGETEVARRIAFVLAAGLAQVSPQPGSSLLAQPDAAQGPSEDDDIV